MYEAVHVPQRTQYKPFDGSEIMIVTAVRDHSSVDVNDCGMHWKITRSKLTSVYRGFCSVMGHICFGRRYTDTPTNTIGLDRFIFCGCIPDCFGTLMLLFTCHVCMLLWFLFHFAVAHPPAPQQTMFAMEITVFIGKSLTER